MVAVNIAIYVWGLQRETDRQTALDPRYRNIGEIILLSKAEVEETAIAQELNKDESAANPGQQTNRAEESSQITPEVAETGLDQEVDSHLEKEGEAAAEAALPAMAGESNVTMPPAVPVTSEVTDERPPARSEGSEKADTDAVAVQQELCWTLGPITQRSAALTVLKAIEKKVASADLREETEKSITGYWVVLPPYENATAANEVVEQLKARGITDVQRFYRGELQNGVSLGIYNQLFNAEKRRAQIVTKGFSPEVLPRYHDVPNFWVDYRSGEEVDILSHLPYEYRQLAATPRKCATQPD